MASVVVDGLVIPVAVAAHPALNFCNTRAGWGTPEPKEYLRSHDHLTVWARENGLLGAAAAARLSRSGAAEPARAAQVVARAVAFRSALYAVLVGPARARDWDAVNREVRAATAASRLNGLLAGPDGPRAAWEVGDPSTLDLPLLAVAWSAAELLTSATAGRVVACPGDGCGWVFADPRGRRRWCSMAWCGNRNKARRYARRHHRSTMDD